MVLSLAEVAALSHEATIAKMMMPASKWAFFMGKLLSNTTIEKRGGERRVVELEPQRGRI
jgi:hypothetical protein